MLFSRILVGVHPIWGLAHACTPRLRQRNRHHKLVHTVTSTHSVSLGLHPVSVDMALSVPWECLPSLNDFESDTTGPHCADLLRCIPPSAQLRRRHGYHRPNSGVRSHSFRRPCTSLQISQACLSYKSRDSHSST
ncbi:hypothetical protein L210DRAFT_2457607 [Boletus edulis BED1]|uniref:Secreted protein n=1 Tax=Boletus edulis BED1 TaxID=1328754 RepID=A0AAD4BPX7_BOLED|nr:hypothetical protein L210DRAFT_2457607 [Boletus edulis BED1]